MERADYRQFCEIVLGFAELKGKQLSAPALELYWRALQHWSLDDFRLAAEQLIRTSEFMPTPKHFEDLRKAGDETAAEAWDAVFFKRGAITQRAKRAAELAAGGRYLGHLDLEREVPHVQRRFMEIYRELADVEQTRGAVPQIAAKRTNGLTHVRVQQVLAALDAGNSGEVDRKDTRTSETVRF